MTTAWPTKLRVSADRTRLTVAWDDGRTDELDAELLRVESPSAEVQGHGPGQKKLVAGKRGIRIENVEPVGNYAVKLIFGDGHATGLFTWRYLREVADGREERWTRYLGALDTAGARRDP